MQLMRKFNKEDNIALLFIITLSFMFVACLLFSLRLVVAACSITFLWSLTFLLFRLSPGERDYVLQHSIHSHTNTSVWTPSGGMMSQHSS